MILTAKEFGDYFIEVDNYNHTLRLSTGKKNKKGVPICETIGYYNTVNSAVLKIMKLRITKLHENDIITMEDYIRDLKQIQEELIKAEYHVKK